MRSQRLDKNTGSEGIVPKLSFKYASVHENSPSENNAASDKPEADQNAAASSLEVDQNAAADHNADAGAPEVDHADAGAPEADHNAAAGAADADQNATEGAPEADHNAAAGAPEADTGPEAEEGLRAMLKGPIFGLYNIVIVGLLLGLNVAAFYCMFAHGASEDERLSIYKWELRCFVLMDVLFVGNLFLKPRPDGCCYNTGMIILMLVCSIVLSIFGAMRASNDASKVLKVLFAVVEVCLVLAQDWLLVRHLLITLD